MIAKHTRPTPTQQPTAFLAKIFPRIEPITTLVVSKVIHQADPRQTNWPLPEAFLPPHHLSTIPSATPCARYVRRGKPIHLPKRINDTDFRIMVQNRAEYRGAVNYHLMAFNVHRPCDFMGLRRPHCSKRWTTSFELQVATFSGVTARRWNFHTDHKRSWRSSLIGDRERNHWWLDSEALSCDGRSL